MTQSLAVRYETERGIVETSTDEVRGLLFAGARIPPTDPEIGLFLKVCEANGMNPFLREAHLVKYEDGKPASIVTGKDWFTKKAHAHPAFEGFEAGVIVRRGDQIAFEEGEFLFPGDVLVGGWATVYRQDTRPFNARVSLQEYSKGQATWTNMPATMIRKVALVHCLREAFPDVLGGLYEAGEMAQGLPRGVDLVREVETAPEVHQPDGFRAVRVVPEGTPTEAPLDVTLCPIHDGQRFTKSKFPDRQTGKYDWVHAHGKHETKKGRDGKPSTVWCRNTDPEVVEAHKARVATPAVAVDPTTGEITQPPASDAQDVPGGGDDTGSSP